MKIGRSSPILVYGVCEEGKAKITIGKVSSLKYTIKGRPQTLLYCAFSEQVL
jgi:hypothetical protein